MSSSSDPNEIEKLNIIVRNKTEAFVTQSIKDGTTLSPEVAAVISGKSVYKERYTFMPILFGLLGISLICVNSANLLLVLCCFLVMFIWYDLFSGILHVVLDNPDFIHLPILDSPCLEFQCLFHVDLFPISSN